MESFKKFTKEKNLKLKIKIPFFFSPCPTYLKLLGSFIIV